AQRAGVETALRWFLLRDDLHRADLRGATDGARREGGAHEIVGVAIFGDPTFDLRYDVHHVRVALDHHHLRDGHAPEAAHAADVVAREINEHEMLRPFLLVGEKLAFERAILLRCGAALAGPGDRPDLNEVIREPHVHLG